MIWSVSNVSGMSGRRKTGSVSGNSPMSPTVRTSMPVASATAVSTMMQISGEGIARKTSGTR